MNRSTLPPYPLNHRRLHQIDQGKGARNVSEKRRALGTRDRMRRLKTQFRISSRPTMPRKAIVRPTAAIQKKHSDDRLDNKVHIYASSVLQ